MTTVAEEGSEVESVDSSVVVTIDTAVSSKGREVVSGLEFALEEIKSTGEVDFLLEDVEDGSLDIVRERVEAANAEGRSVESDVSQEVVSAGKEHLEEVLERKTTIFVRVKEADKAVGLGLGSAEVTLVSEEVEDFSGANESVSISVKSLEGRVGSEIADGAEALSGGLEAHLAVTDSGEEGLKSLFRFESKGHVS